MNRRIACAAALLVLIASTGCSTLSRAGYGDRGTFNDGVLTTRFDQDVGITYEVAVKALTDLDVAVVSAAKDETGARIQAVRQQDETPIVIGFTWRRHDTTGATIKVGEQGDETYSRTIVKAIQERMRDWHRESDLNREQPERTTTGY